MNNLLLLGVGGGLLFLFLKQKKDPYLDTLKRELENIRNEYNDLTDESKYEPKIISVKKAVETQGTSATPYYYIETTRTENRDGTYIIKEVSYHYHFYSFKETKYSKEDKVLSTTANGGYSTSAVDKYRAYSSQSDIPLV